jgi:probable rRNA maturation factor
MTGKGQRHSARGAEMSVLIDVEDDDWRRVPDLEQLTERAVAAALAHDKQAADSVEVSVLFTGDAEAQRINKDWRNKTYVPNVLSFPAIAGSAIPEGEVRPLGDIVLAAGTVAREAPEQGKTLEQHVAHLLVHGTLHLLGYDHMNDTDANKMEAAETAILRGLGFADPYVT